MSESTKSIGLGPEHRCPVRKVVHHWYQHGAPNELNLKGDCQHVSVVKPLRLIPEEVACHGCCISARVRAMNS